MKRMRFWIGLLALASVTAAGCQSGNSAPRRTAYSAVGPGAGSPTPVYSAPVPQSPSPAYSPPPPGGAPAYGAPAPAGESPTAYGAPAAATAGPSYSRSASATGGPAPAYRDPVSAGGGTSCH